MRIISYSVSVVLMVLLMSALNASGEYYQYTDPNGIVRFTDDPSLVPPEQREEALVYESFVTYPEDPEPLLISTEDEKETSPADDVDMETVDEAPPLPSIGSGDRIGAAKLIAMREQIVKAHNELEAAKKTSGTRELNQKIEIYNQRCMEFNEKAKAFNRRITET